jgi:hypothetical protein
MASYNVVLIVIDSLRARALNRDEPKRPHVPFFDRLSEVTLNFRHAYATECWTLPAHLGMFTGLLPAEHGAHFQTMGYCGSRPTIAQLFAEGGYYTEVITRNAIFDGTVPGATRGFSTNTRLLAKLRLSLAPVALGLVLMKPRLRRVMRDSGFSHIVQRERADFIMTLARLGIPADRPVLEHALAQMETLSRRRTPYFLFLNLYDVHAPYSPSATSPLRSFRRPTGWLENLMLPSVLPRISSHGYLRPGFRLSGLSRRMLLDRYHRAIELMDQKLSAFYSAASGAGLLKDTILIVTSDHGEAFGDHGLYFHDASVYNTHLHVPLWIQHPEIPPKAIDDVVSTKALFDFLTAIAASGGLAGTLLDNDSRAANGVALAEHFHYPYTDGLLPRYTHNIAAAVVGSQKLIVRSDGLEHYDLARDPHELAPHAGTVPEFERACRKEGFAERSVATAVEHVRRWQKRLAAA